MGVVRPTSAGGLRAVRAMLQRPVAPLSKSNWFLRTPVARESAVRGRRRQAVDWRLRAAFGALRCASHRQRLSSGVRNQRREGRGKDVGFHATGERRHRQRCPRSKYWRSRRQHKQGGSHYRTLGVRITLELVLSTEPARSVRGDCGLERPALLDRRRAAADAHDPAFVFQHRCGASRLAVRKQAVVLQHPCSRW